MPLPTTLLGSLLGANKITRQKTDPFKSTEELRQLGAFMFTEAA